MTVLVPVAAAGEVLLFELDALKRDVRGVAIKFYTEDGNYDVVGNNTPIFFIRDPMKFPDFIHSQLRLPDTGMRSNAKGAAPGSGPRWNYGARSNRGFTARHPNGL